MNGGVGKHIDAYLEYVKYAFFINFFNSIVGNADGGKMMNEAEFEEFKNNIREARKNRLYVTFRNSDGQDCRIIGPSS